MVVEVECVTGMGEVLHLPRRTQGLNLVDLMVGSEGTLAILTAAPLRLHPAPAHRVFSSWSFPTTQQGMVALRNLVQQGLRPAVARLYDPFDAFLARQGSRKTPSKPRRPHQESSEFSDVALRQLLRRPWVFNEFLGHPISERCLGGALLVLIFEGAETDTRRDLAETTELFRSAGSDLGAKDLGEAPARFWFENRYAVSFRMAPMVAKGIFVDTMEVVAPWSKLSNVYNAVRKALGRTTFVMAHFSHAYADGCCIYFSFAGSASMHLFSRTHWDEACRQTYDETWARALDAATTAGACFAHHHGVGRSKASNLPIELGVGFEALQGIKRAFDPGAILNPGNLGSGSHPAAVPPTEISP